jgi:hypothetical protein
MARKPLTKADMERIFAAAGIRPERRVTYRGYEIFVGEGFSAPPHTIYQKFGIDADKHPYGCFIDWYWVGKDESLFFGSVLDIDAFHNPGWSVAGKKQIRINTALKAARRDIDSFMAKTH